MLLTLAQTTSIYNTNQMTRIQPEYFIECYKHINNHIKQYEFWILDDFTPERICSKETVAIFLAKPQSTSLAERLDARGLQTFKP